MQYIGGKQKSGGHKIAAHVKCFADAFGTEVVWEPFCGGLSVTYRLAKLGLRVHASDACEPLIVLYRAVRDGWEPPEVVTRETWEQYRHTQPAGDPMTAFCGFGCSRSGAWFGGFVERYKYTKRTVPAATAARGSLKKKLAACGEGVTFNAYSYDRRSHMYGVLYCDPPYADSLGYPAVGPFDHAEFWRWAYAVSNARPVLVSERVAPEPWVILDEWSLQSRITTKAKTRRVERVFVHPKWASLV